MLLQLVHGHHCTIITRIFCRKIQRGALECYKAPPLRRRHTQVLGNVCRRTPSFKSLTLFLPNCIFNCSRAFCQSKKLRHLKLHSLLLLTDRYFFRSGSSAAIYCTRISRLHRPSLSPRASASITLNRFFPQLFLLTSPPPKSLFIRQTEHFVIYGHFIPVVSSLLVFSAFPALSFHLLRPSFSKFKAAFDALLIKVRQLPL